MKVFIWSGGDWGAVAFAKDEKRAKELVSSRLFMHHPFFDGPEVVRDLAVDDGNEFVDTWECDCRED